jgi:sugar phosphate isomerase/epimerase
MHLSAWVFATDLLPSKKSLLEKFIKRHNLFTEKPPSEVFKTLKSAGFDGIELLIPKDFSEDDFNKVQTILNENQMPVNSLHQPLRLFTKTNLKEVETLFILANKFHAKVIVLHLANAKNQIFNKNYLGTLHEFENKYNIKIGFENTQKFAQVFNKKMYYDSKIFPKTIKDAGFLMTLDTTHLADTKADIISFIKNNLKNIVNIQLSDYRKSFPIPYLHLPLLKGSLPIEEFLKILKENNYDGLMTLEIKTNLEGLYECARIVRRFIN